jgi:hypothetical protein
MAGRKKQADVSLKELVNDMVPPAAKPEEDINSMPLNSLGDYLRYNAKAREMNKKLGLCRYRIKQCPEELHPKERVIVTYADGSNNDIPVYKSDEMIDYKARLKPGKEYSLPRYIVEYLANKGTVNWERRTMPDGSVETIANGFKPRFAVRTIYR